MPRVPSLSLKLTVGRVRGTQFRQFLEVGKSRKADGHPNATEHPTLTPFIACQVIDMTTGFHHRVIRVSQP